MIRARYWRAGALGLSLILPAIVVTAAVAAAKKPASRTSGPSTKGWTLWSAGKVAQIVVADNATPGELDAASELQKFLAQMGGSKPAILSEKDASTQNVILVGNTRRGIALPVAGVLKEARLREESYRMVSDVKSHTLSLRGGSDMATKFAVYDFLTRYCGVRWYLPTDLFQVVPHHAQLALPAFDVVETPAFAPRTFGYVWHGATVSYAGESDPQFGTDRWTLRNRLSVDGRLRSNYSSHNLFNVVVGSRDFEVHPEWFPLRGGARLKPPTDDYQDWQPEVTNPEVVEKFIEAGRKFFGENPHSWQWFSLGINDGDGWSESAEAMAENGNAITYRGRLSQSNVYYKFVTKVAEALLKEFPDRKIGVIAYYAVEAPPTDIKRLPPNVNVVITQESAQRHDARYREQDNQLVRDWVRVTGGNVYRYDYQSLGWLVPRYYPGLMAEDARAMKKIGLRGYYTEDGPTWITMGPLPWLTTQVWWNPAQNEKKRVAEFCKELFGPAAPAMQRYFEVWEASWMRTRDGRFFEGLFGVQGQVAVYREQDRLQLESLMQQARKLAATDIEKRRIEFFAVGWKFTDFYLKESHLEQQLTQLRGRERGTTAIQLLKTLDEHAAWDEEFKKQDALTNGTYRWVRETLGRYKNWPESMRASASAALLPALLEETQGDAALQAARLAEMKREVAGTPAQVTIDLLESWLATPSPPNSLLNSVFNAESAPEDWKAGPPESWGFWTSLGGTIEHRKGAIRFRGVDTGVALQDVPVREGEVIRAAVHYRTNPGFSGQVVLRCRWKDAKGAWYPEDASLDIIGFGPEAVEERELSVMGRVPQGAAVMEILIGSGGQSKDDWIEMRESYFGHKK
jgi:hypothetical protein